MCCVVSERRPCRADLSVACICNEVCANARSTTVAGTMQRCADICTFSLRASCLMTSCADLVRDLMPSAIEVRSHYCPRHFLDIGIPGLGYSCVELVGYNLVRGRPMLCPRDAPGSFRDGLGFQFSQKMSWPALE
eukprot:7119495-Pyramimonas_sp.AAC.1